MRVRAGTRWTVVSAGRVHFFAGYDLAIRSALLQHAASLGFRAVW